MFLERDGVAVATVTVMKDDEGLAAAAASASPPLDARLARGSAILCLTGAARREGCTRYGNAVSFRSRIDWPVCPRLGDDRHVPRPPGEHFGCAPHSGARADTGPTRCNRRPGELPVPPHTRCPTANTTSSLVPRPRVWASAWTRTACRSAGSPARSGVRPLNSRLKG